MALEIVQILASGTFGHVAVVRDSATGDLLAAKVLKDMHASNPRLVSRLRDEATMLARVQHANVVGLAELRPVGGRPVLLMQWIRGAPLASVLARNPSGLRVPDVCAIIRATADALHAAHETPDPVTGEPIRLIHRDLKPSNLLLEVDGSVKIVDLGIAKGSFSGKESETVSVVLGAQGYLAPERLDGAEDSQAGDVFALGCVFFELLTSRKIQLSLHPGHHAERMQRHLMHLRPEGASPPVVQKLTDLIQRMAAYEETERPTHLEVVATIDQLFMMTGWRADLPGLAERDVVPLLMERKYLAPHMHPAWDSLSFLEEPSGATPPGAPPREADAALRAFLADPSWHLRVRELHRLVAIDPSWTEAPLLEALTRIERSQRRGCLGLFGRRRFDSRARKQVLALLDVLRTRPTEAVRRRAWRLVGSPDPAVASLAQELYASG